MGNNNEPNPKKSSKKTTECLTFFTYACTRKKMLENDSLDGTRVKSGRVSSCQL